MIGLRQMDDIEIEEPLDAPMINVNDETGMAYWECGSCGRILTWSEYNGTAPLPYDEGFRSTTRSSTAIHAPVTETRMSLNLPTPEQ
eukprot:1920819-Heterocapsa_arctica.AAC.1